MKKLNLIYLYHLKCKNIQLRKWILWKISFELNLTICYLIFLASLCREEVLVYEEVHPLNEVVQNDVAPEIADVYDYHEK
jgi:hypothetical protein